MKGLWFVLLLMVSSHQLCVGISSTEGLVSIKQESQDEVKRQISRLYSKDAEDRIEAKTELLKAASTHAEVRSEIIRLLIKVLDDVSNIVEQSLYDTWYDAAELVGELEAVETIDVLVKYLDFNNGTMGLSTSHYPALRAIIQIGKPAVPKLAKTLLEGESVLTERKSAVRENAARALGSIGGDQAKESLKQVLINEMDEDVIWYIESSLQTIYEAENSKPLKKKQ